MMKNDLSPHRDGRFGAFSRNVFEQRRNSVESDGSCSVAVTGQNGDIVVSLTTKVPDEYSFFNRALFNNWAGPDHWRPSARAGLKTARDAAVEKKKGVKAKFSIDFFGQDNTDWYARRVALCCWA
jgi:hypothetical protein